MSLLKDKPLKKCHTDNRKMIDDIHEDMIKDMNSEELNEYYLDNGLLLDKYYRNDNVNNTDNSGILSYFGKKTNEDSNNENNRKEILCSYMSNIDDNILNQKRDLYEIFATLLPSSFFQSNNIGSLYFLPIKNLLGILKSLFIIKFIDFKNLR